MRKQVLFIQGGGDDGYEADRELVNALTQALGKSYRITYPELQSDESAPAFGWLKQVEQEISAGANALIIVAHSLGASMLLKYLSENTTKKKIAGIFLLATPFWSGNEGWKKGLKLKRTFADTLPVGVPMFPYHCKDDEEVPFTHVKKYQQKLTQATFRELKQGGHSFKDALDIVAQDIKAL